MGEKDYIAGIYNYCDGWCEKCPFTSKCEYYNVSVKPFSEDDKDIDEEENEMFWGKLHQLFSDTYDVLKELAIEHDIDISDIEEDIEEEEDDDFIDDESEKIIEKSELVKLCDKYESLTGVWFYEAESSMKIKEQSINNLIDMEIPGLDVERMALTVNDSIEVVNWYLFLIQERVRKALFDKMKDSPNKDENDYNGSAKVLLIGIDRSIIAWTSLYEQFEKTEDEILKILLILSELRERIEVEFPEARKYERVGLD